MEKIKNKEGFTLLEVIFAVSILTVGILAVAAMQSSSIRGNAFAWDTSEASAVAMSRMETLMNLPYDDDDLTDGDHGPITVTTSGRTYNIEWNVSDDEFIDETKTVRLTVSWTYHGLLPRNISMAFTLGQVV